MNKSSLKNNRRGRPDNNFRPRTNFTLKKYTLSGQRKKLQRPKEQKKVTTYINLLLGCACVQASDRHLRYAKYKASCCSAQKHPHKQATPLPAKDYKDYNDLCIRLYLHRLVGSILYPDKIPYVPY